MRIVRRHLPLLALLSVLSSASACAKDASPVGTAPVVETDAPARRVLQRVVGLGADDQPIDAWMGDTLVDVVRVRVVDARGRPLPGVPVHFRMGEHDGVLSRSVGGRTEVVVKSDTDGVATAGTWRLPRRDTVVTHHVVMAQLADGDTTGVTFIARAWRDLTRFGGDAPLVIDRLPIDRRLVAAIRPLGTLSGDDALPSADAVLELRTSAASAVHAVADGVITELDEAAGAVTMRVRDRVRVRVGGVSLQAGLWVGRVLHAGDTLGMVDVARAGSVITVRVLDGAVQRASWVRPERYGARRSTVFFVRYLADSLRSAAYGLVRRAAPDLDGRIDFDRDGRLIGTWFDATSPVIADLAQGVTAAATARFPSTISTDVDPSESLAPLALTFAYDAERPGQVRIAAGRALAVSLGFSGVRAVAWEDPDPSEVGESHGVVRYRLFAADDASRIGRPAQVLLAQLVDAQTLRVELVDGRDVTTVAFSARAITLMR